MIDIASIRMADVPNLDYKPQLFPVVADLLRRFPNACLVVNAACDFRVLENVDAVNPRWREKLWVKPGTKSLVPMSEFPADLYVRPYRILAYERRLFDEHKGTKYAALWSMQHTLIDVEGLAARVDYPVTVMVVSAFHNPRHVKAIRRLGIAYRNSNARLVLLNYGYEIPDELSDVVTANDGVVHHVVGRIPNPWHQANEVWK